MLIDWEQLDAIADGWPEDFVVIFREFLLELPSDIDALQEAAESGDAAILARIAHRLKGCSANFGFEKVREAALRIEKQAKAECLDEIPTCISDARMAFQSACEEVADCVPALKALTLS